jgi:bifunctional non-homologous end joining protein LigD
MSLTRYKAKRDFKQTSEPAGGAPKSKSLVFVVQKHNARNLHYDFRLQMEGTLKSWAVPKGPSTDPEVKRLAMEVEDHPYDYKDFEGTIPEGNYGAGTVIVWDNGTYEPIEEFGTKKEQEKHLLKQWKEGSLKIKLHGKKLKGEWALVRTKQSDNSWLLIKHKDKYASESDITSKSKSVVSGKTIEQLEKATKRTQEKTASSGVVQKTKSPKKVTGKATAKAVKKKAPV